MGGLLACLCLLGTISNNLFGNLEEHFINIAACFGRCFKEFETVLLSQGLPLLGRYHSVRQIGFIGYQNLGHSAAGMLINLLQPVLDISEGCLFRAIVD